MLVPQPTSFTLSDPDSLHYLLIPSTPSDLAPSFAPAHAQTRVHVPASASTLSRPTRQYRQRRLRNLLKSNSSTIYGVWDIQIKSEHRSLSKAKAKAGAGGSNRDTTGNKQTTAGDITRADGSLQDQNPPLHATSSTSSNLKVNIPENSEAGSFASQDFLQMSQTNNVASNATTEWTVGQQQRDRINARSHVASKPSLLQQASAPNSIPMQYASHNAANARSDDGSSSAVADPLSARSKFLKAIGIFRSKHLLQKRPNSNTPATGPETVSATIHTSGRIVSPSNASSSHVPPPLHHGLDSNVQSRESSNVTSDSRLVSDDSYVGQRPLERRRELPSDLEMVDTALQSHIRLAEDRPASSSLRVKLKNRVHNTLASMRSSSNLRDRARLQAAATVVSENTQEHQQQHKKQQQQQSSSSDCTTNPDVPSPRSRHAFWSLPRTRPDSTGTTGSRQIPWNISTGPSSVTEQSTAQNQEPTKEQDTAMLSPELASRFEPFNQAAVDEVNSDDSMDIIMPSDYDDYTQFAELPLKKRKKMLAAAAAAAAASQDPSHKRPQASRMNSDAMKRFLLQQKSANDEGRSKKKQPQITDGGPSGIPDQQTSQKNSKKRPKDQDSIEQEQQTEPNKLAKSNSNDLPEWRKAIMRSLHLGRGNQSKRNSKDLAAADQSTRPSQIDSTTHIEQGHSSHRDSGVYPEDQSHRFARSGSINSVRSRSMATSTHTGLLATTLATPRGTIVARRETLEMAMRRRRRSSAARSSIFGTEGIHVPGVGAAHDDDAASTTNITHTFTSFTLELADIQHAHAIVNNSVTPGLFNFKRPPRFTMSSVNQLDTDQEFKCFDSDGDAISGYTGDADVSMEDTFFVRPKTPVTPKASEGRDKGKARVSGGSDILTRRRLSSIEGDSDTLPELPVLTIRTRDLNRSGSGGRPNSANSNGRESPRSPKRVGTGSSPTLSRKPTRNFMSGSPIVTAASGSSSPPKELSTTLSLEEVVSWKPRNILQPVRPPVPALNTKPLATTRGSNLSTSSTLITSSRTPYSATSTLLTQSPSFLSSPTGPTRNGPEAFHHHRQQSSSSHQRHPSHYQQASSDTLIPNHLKNFSTASTLSTSSGYSAQTLTANSPLTAYQSGLPLHHSQPVMEFDPSQEFPPTTPVDLKAMDFDTLLKTAEQEQRKGREEMTLKKKKTFHNLNQLQQQQQQQQQQLPLRIQRQIVPSNDLPGGLRSNNKPLAVRSSLSAALGKSASSVEELRIQSHNAYAHKNTGHTASGYSGNTGGITKNNGMHIQTNRHDPSQQQQQQQSRQHLSAQGPLRITIPKVNMALEASDIGVGATGAARNDPRSRRVMKKKMSVIKLSGKVQGRREDDGMIRVSVASPARASS